MSMNKKRFIAGCILLVIYTIFNNLLLSRFLDNTNGVFELSLIISSFLTILVMIYIELTILNEK